MTDRHALVRLKAAQAWRARGAGGPAGNAFCPTGPGSAPTLHHLPGKHDQKSHGRHGTVRAKAARAAKARGAEADKKKAGGAADPHPPAKLIDPSKPIGERIAAYDRGESVRKAILEIPERTRAARQEIAAAADRREQLFVKAANENRRLRKAEKEEYDRLGARMSELNKQLVERAGSDREDAHAILFAAVTDRVEVRRDDFSISGNPVHEKAHDEGLAFVEKVLGKGFGPDMVPDQRTVTTRPIPPGEKQRDHCEYDGTVMLSDDTGPATMVHEMGHWVEFRVPGAKAAALDFLEHRVGNENPQRLKDVVPGSGYEDHELGRRDNFEAAFGERSAWYVGKTYGGQATEVLSMGVEKLYEDPVGFAKADPEHFKLVVGVLDGSLRNH